MSDYKLNGDGSYAVEDGDFVLLTGADAIRQHIQIRLRFFRGEWHLNPEEGIPYYSQILTKTMSLGAIESLFRETVAGTPGVSKIQSLNLTYNENTRHLSVSFSALVDEDITLVFEEFVL